MAMKACKECGREVRTEATACPHCGTTRPTVGWPLGGKVAVGLIGLIVIGQALADRSPSTGTQASLASVAPPVDSQSVAVPTNQQALLENYRQACERYDAQPNEIKKSAVFRESSSLVGRAGAVRGWAGTLSRISTNQGGSTATLVIKIGSSQVWDDDVALGSSVYTAATNIVEGQPVTFSGRNLKDFNLTERGKVCDPDFKIHLTALN